jgi:hypothetical protein
VPNAASNARAINPVFNRFNLVLQKVKLTITAKYLRVATTQAAQAALEA